jgi:hypothetical protein
MKYSICILTACILLAFVSCKKQAGPVAENYISNYIPLNSIQSFDMEGEILTCLLDTVFQDSRCPTNATCVWQGAAVARFKISLENTHNTLTLATARFGEYDTNTTVAGFKIEFINLVPHPVSGKVVDYNEYVAEVKITKL